VGKGDIHNQTHRYLLWRYWGDGPKVLFVMLNPSIADHETDDPTIRRCISFAKSWGYDGIEVVNLFAYRATKPRELRKSLSPVGADNNEIIQRTVVRNIRAGGRVVAAWGAWGSLFGRDLEVKQFITRYTDLWCIRKTKSGAPGHPLYLPASLRGEVYATSQVTEPSEVASPEQS